MRPIEQIDDLDQLKQVAVLLEKENQRLHERLQSQTQELATLRGEDGREALQLELEKLQAEMARLQRRLLGNPSEKRPQPRTQDASPAQRSGHGPRPQPELPIKEQVHELAPEERGCPVCAGQLDEWPDQYEESEEVTVVERRFELVRHKRQKYRCRCNASVVTAPGPLKLIAGGRFSLDFAVAVAVDKYLDHLPLERQSRMMQRSGLTASSQTLWDQLRQLGRVLEPSYGRLRQHVLSSPVVHADETWWRLMTERNSKNWWSWCLTTPDAALYQILASRSKESAREALGDFRGIVVADGYAVYKSLARAGPSFALAHCWAHVRRHFIEIEQFYPEPCKELLDLIGELYAIERELPEDLDESEQLAARRALRQQRSRAVIGRIRDWAYGQRGSPGSELAKAVRYMLRIWEGLTRFLDDPRVPLDNNAAERALRGPVLGRKNHYGSRSLDGINVAATLYSLLETAKLCGVDPAAYLRAAAAQALESPGSALLPHDISA